MVRLFFRAAFSLALIAWGCACPRPPPPPVPQVPPTPPPPVVPRGCLDTFAGQWVHAEDPSWHYEADDDGGTLSFVVTHVPIVDAGLHFRRFGPVRDAGVADAGVRDSGSEDAGEAPPVPPVIVLERTPSGFVGSVHSSLVQPDGKTCELSWRAEVTACSDAGLSLSTEVATAVSDDCKSAPADGGMSVQRLIRAGP